jgi:hypothetical protein
MNVRQIGLIVCRHRRVIAREADVRAQHLRNFGYLPRGAYGRNAPDATPENAAIVLLGAFCNLRQSRAAKALTPFVNLRASANDTQSRPIFLVALTELLRHPSLAAYCREVWICRNQPFAEIRFANGQQGVADDVTRFYSRPPAKSNADGWPEKGIHFSRIPGDLIREISIALISVPGARIGVAPLGKLAAAWVP